jgi:DNA primase
MERYMANKDKLSVWKDEGMSPDSMEKFQVRFDPFANRLVFPIRSLDGKIINICGRTLNPNYKEQKIRKYCYYFELGRLDTLYGFYENKENILHRQEIILFEGSKSVMIADSWGIHNTAAILTSHLNPYQFEILVKLGVRVVFALDADVDIKEDKNIRRLLPYVQVEYIKDVYKLLDSKDAPVDRGKEIFDRLYLERRRL